MRTILYVPPEGSLLLAEGLSRSRPPSLYFDVLGGGQWREGWFPNQTQGLVLAYEGAPCLSGCELSQRVLAQHEGLSPRSGVLFRDTGTPGECYLQVGSQPVGRSWAVTYGPYKQDPLNGVPHHQVPNLRFRDTPKTDPLVREWKLAHVLAERLGGGAVFLP